jgi:hypothetical protein
VEKDPNARIAPSIRPQKEPFHHLNKGQALVVPRLFLFGVVWGGGQPLDGAGDIEKPLV